jgi:hypothetical protein
MQATVDLNHWIGTLPDRLARGEFANLAPFNLGDGTGTLPGQTTIRIMLADLDHLEQLPATTHEPRTTFVRLHDLFRDFTRLRELIG